jgi:hypothetical protein
MSLIVICEHSKSGNKREFDIFENYEFKRRYGHLLEATQLSMAHNLLAEWILQAKRTGYHYSIKDISL